MFALINFCIFGIFLLLSLLVGIYRGIERFSNKERRKCNINEFLNGDHKLSVFPVCLSLLTTFVSGIGLLRVPAEIYTEGPGMFIYIMSGTLAFPIIGFFFFLFFIKLR